MHECRLTSKELQEAASQQTRELREMARNLSFWMDGVHYPSEGQYLEYVVRAYLRRRIPKRFEISTGFISTLEANVQAGGQPEVTRKVSRQFDILIWDADTFPALFRADDFVIVIPESVRAIIEVTKCLNTEKVREDLKKFDDLYELYSCRRQRFRPYTAMLAFSSKLPCPSNQMTTLLQCLERFYLFDSDIPILFRYQTVRNKGIDTLPLPLPGFLDSICILDEGLVKGVTEITKIDPPVRNVVKYVAYSNESHVEASFGIFERDIMLTLSQSAAEASGCREASVDVYREFMHTSFQKACSSLIIEDWNSILPSLNVIDKNSPRKSCNVSRFVGVDFVDDHPRPKMYVEHFGPKIWAFERHSNNLFACGLYNRGSRVKKWCIFVFDKDRRTSFPPHRFKIEEKSFLEVLENAQTIALTGGDSLP